MTGTEELAGRDGNSAEATLSNPADTSVEPGVESTLDRVPMLAELFDDARPPDSLGQYQFLSELGRGAMGVVYAAYDQKLGRKVAIKLLKRRTDAKARRRFLREAQAMARLSHPNVVQVYDIDELDGVAFIVMEYIRGVTLHDWLARQPRTHEEIVELFCAVGNGLVAAHSRGLVHRDFKPANVMVNEDGRVLVMDFGLAREWTRDESSTANLRGGALLERMTTKGNVVGTPIYMAPEQFEGRDIDSRADQFSFCIALWEALYGQRPFRATTMRDLAIALKRGNIQMPEDERNVPRWRRAVLLRGLRLDPEQRWPSMKELLDALRNEPAGDVEEIELDTRAPRPWPWATIVIAFALAGFAALLAWVVLG